MGILEKVKIDRSLCYDFLASIYRLINNEKIISELDSISNDENIRPDKYIVSWVEENSKYIPENKFTKMKRFFNHESYFGLCLLPFIAINRIVSVEEFLNLLTKVPPEKYLEQFIDTGYGPKDGKVSIELVLELLKDNKKASNYINNNLSLPADQKWELFQFFLEPERMKEDLLDLLKWYYENIYSKERDRTKRIIIEAENEIVGYLNKYGEEYLRLLTNRTEHSTDKNVNKIIISISYFYEFNLFASGTEENDYIYLIGYKYPEIFVNKKHTLLSNVDLFKALADETRLNILRLLSKRSMYGREIAAELGLSNSNVSYHTSMLALHGLIRKEKEDNKMYFVFDKQQVKQILNDAIDEL